jgi:glycerol-3-phosphate dehydrogenase
VRPPAEDVEYLLGATNAFFGTRLTVDEVVGAYAGVRPLISSGDSRKSVDISRRAELYETSSGLITITGGKLTTWRRMAKMAVDRLVERDGLRAPCRTDEIPLGQPVDLEQLRAPEGVGPEQVSALAARYGFAAAHVLELASERPELAAPVVDGLPDLLAEVAFAARHEQALTVGDVLLRRTRIGLLAGRAITRPDSQVPRRVAEVLAGELGWSPAQVEAEVRRFADEAEVEGIALA